MLIILIATIKMWVTFLKCCQSFYPHSGPMKELLCLQFSVEGVKAERVNSAHSHTTGEFGRMESEPLQTFFGFLLSNIVVSP